MNYELTLHKLMFCIIYTSIQLIGTYQYYVYFHLYYILSYFTMYSILAFVSCIMYIPRDTTCCVKGIWQSLILSLNIFHQNEISLPNQTWMITSERSCLGLLSYFWCTLWRYWVYNNYLRKVLLRVTLNFCCMLWRYWFYWYY